MAEYLPEDEFLALGVPKPLQSICRRCGFFRVHGKHCLACAMAGRYGTGREVLSETMKICVQIAQNLPPGHETREYVEKHLLATRAQVSKYRHCNTWTANKRRTLGHRILRAKQLRLVRLLLGMVLRCFERDMLGQWQLYEDRTPELRPTLDMVERLLPELDGSIDIKGAVNVRARIAVNEAKRKAAPKEPPKRRGFGKKRGVDLSD